MCNYERCCRGTHARIHRSISQKKKCHAITIFSLIFNSGPLPARVNCGSYALRERGIYCIIAEAEVIPLRDEKQSLSHKQLLLAQHNEAARQSAVWMRSEFLSEASGPLQHTPHIYKYTLLKLSAHLTL
jgi:hypothetical protein